jgi:hypothetical protein
VTRLVEWLKVNETVLRAVYRVAVVAVLAFVLFELREHRPYFPSLRELERDVDRIQRDVQAMAEKIGASAPPVRSGPICGFLGYWGAECERLLVDPPKK